MTGSGDNITFLQIFLPCIVQKYTKSYYTALIDDWRQQLRPLYKTTFGLLD